MGYELAEYLFSKKEGKKRVSLDEIESHRGLGRAAVLGVLTGTPAGSLVGGYIGKKYADKLDEEGDYRGEKNGKKLIRKAGIAGAIGGAAVSAPLAYATSRKGRGGRAAVMAAGLGAVGAGFGARRNTRERLNKRSLREAGVDIIE